MPFGEIRCGMTRVKTRTLVGLQNPVMGFIDPFQPERYLEFFRGGENYVQDPMPTEREYVEMCQLFGLDFVMHHAVPMSSDVGKLVERLDRHGLQYILGNEFYNFNGVFEDGCSRGDIDLELLRGARGLIGLLYDETEHLQIHSRYYHADNPYFHWADPNGGDMDDAEDAIFRAVSARVKACDKIPVYTEHVFPIMNHIMARAGCSPCPKIMKEEFNSLTMAVAMGAAKQYGRSFGICCDLWGPDLGQWFTRFWGMPGHSPQEFESSLKAAWLLCPSMMFVENVDALVRSGNNGLSLTEFGEVFRDFAAWRETQYRPYAFEGLRCKTAVIRSDDCIMSELGTFTRKGCFGADGFLPDSRNLSFIRVMHALMHKTAAAHSLTMHNCADYRLSAFRRYPWTKEELKELPLNNGIPDAPPSEHRCVYPLDEVLVFDEKVSADTVGNPELVILCSSRADRATAQTIETLMERGARAIAADWFRGLFSDDSDVLFVEDFQSKRFSALIERYLGDPTEWNVGFGEYTLSMREDNGFRYEIRKRAD